MRKKIAAQNGKKHGRSVVLEKEIMITINPFTAMVFKNHP